MVLGFMVCGCPKWDLTICSYRILIVLSNSLLSLFIFISQQEFMQHLCKNIKIQNIHSYFPSQWCRREFASPPEEMEFFWFKLGFTIKFKSYPKKSYQSWTPSKLICSWFVSKSKTLILFLPLEHRDKSARRFVFYS